MKCTRRTALVGGLALVSGCLSDADENPNDEERTDTDGGTDDVDEDEIPDGNPTHLEISGYVYTESAIATQVTAVPSTDERFDDASVWQTAFERIAERVRADAEWINSEDASTGLGTVALDTPEAESFREIYDGLPVSYPEDYTNGKYVEHVVDGESTYTRVETFTPTPD